MNWISYLLLYVPLCFMVLVILEAIKSENPVLILKKAASNFLMLSGILIAIGLIFFLILKYV